MAITQERMMDIITAGIAWKEAFTNTSDQIEIITNYLESGDYTQAEAVEFLKDLRQRLTPRLDTILPLDVEKRYYETNARKNERAKIYARGKRHLFTQDGQERQKPLLYKHPQINQPLARHRTDIISESEMAAILAKANKE